MISSAILQVYRTRLSKTKRPTKTRKESRAEMFGHFLIFIGFTFLANPALSISGRFDILNKTGFLASLYFFLSGTVRSAIGFYWIRSTGTPLTPAQVCSGLEMLIGGLALGWWGFSKQFKEVLDKTLHFES